MGIQVVGVYPVEAPEPCHLVELVVEGGSPLDAVAQITQETAGEPRDQWQVPWDERVLDRHGAREQEGDPDPASRVVFFFHYLSFERPLLTPFGPVPLPAPTSRPQRLDFIDYEPP